MPGSANVVLIVVVVVLVLVAAVARTLSVQSPAGALQ
jgi:hypothetical protein